MELLWDARHRRLVYVADEATSHYWDEHWEQNDEHLARLLGKPSVRSALVRTIRRYLAPASVFLEAGCGMGQHVAALRGAGYRCLGLDFAAATLRRVRAAAPGLPLVVGDVFHLPLADGSVDGCWSGGVIEHFWDGYGPILDEMARVVRPGGFVFITFPHLSALRRLKAGLGRYRAHVGEDRPDGFYQFALDQKAVHQAFLERGFVPRLRRARGGVKGLKDEVGWLRAPLQKLFDAGRVSRPAKVVKTVLDLLLAPFAGHTLLSVYQRRAD